MIQTTSKKPWGDLLRAFVQNKWIKCLGIALFFLLLIYFFRYPIMRGMGNVLIAEDTPEKSDVILVLGGGSVERGMAAAKLYQEGYAPLIVTTGNAVPSILKLMDTVICEARLAQIQITATGCDPTVVEPHCVGTSTMEEAVYLEKLCQERNWNKVIIVSSKLHLKRVRFVFEDRFTNAGIETRFCGASGLKYDEAEWWKSEEGLIMVNNEYIKLFYYWWKY